ncbi:hypothetical protein I7I51_02607 [Histoplasma capsulatum]|uniref:Uncharacterized protein n=1 Tax=Ajellomyces capsulatus TaxID=5037 RepID=A0A8A1ME21_AJECA|nr:hypothetical protein I7I51_02607 [Histoplasma capsulatum]
MGASVADKPSPPSFLRWGRVRRGISLSQERQLVCDMWRTEIRDPPSPTRYKVGGGQRGARQFPRLRESKVSDIKFPIENRGCGTDSALGESVRGHICHCRVAFWIVEHEEENNSAHRSSKDQGCLTLVRTHKLLLVQESFPTLSSLSCILIRQPGAGRYASRNFSICRKLDPRYDKPTAIIDSVGEISLLQPAWSLGQASNGLKILGFNLRSWLGNFENEQAHSSLLYCGSSSVFPVSVFEREHVVGYHTCFEFLALGSGLRSVDETNPELHVLGTMG